MKATTQETNTMGTLPEYEWVLCDECRTMLYPVIMKTSHGICRIYRIFMKGHTHIPLVF